MPIVASDIQFRLSGGAANSNVDASLGGAKSSVQIVDASLNNLFDQVSGGESSAGDVEYRCFYIHNAHATLTLEGAVLWFVSNTPSPGTLLELGLGGAVNAVAGTVANESTAPAGVAFSAPSTKATGLIIGNIPPGQHQAVWLRRTVTAGASAFNNDNAVLRVEGETAA